jgi:hypothetical protein
MTIIIITFFFTFSKIVNCFFFNFKFGTVFIKSYSEIETELDDYRKKTVVKQLYCRIINLIFIVSF